MQNHTIGEREISGVSADIENAFCLTEKQKALRVGLSVSFLQKDRLKPNPTFEFKRYGRSIRYRLTD